MVSRERIREVGRLGYYRNHEKRLKEKRLWRLNNKDTISIFAKSERGKEIQKQYRLRLKIKVFSYYSKSEPKCQCCKISDLDVLTIDHIGGRKLYNHDKSMNGAVLYRWLKKNDYPDGFRVLCYNCNFSTGKNNNIENKCAHNISIKRSNNYYSAIKFKVLKHYSDNLSCQKCNEECYDFLILDHKYGGGNKHRKELPNNGHSIYEWVRRNNYPNIFRVLCMNCNIKVCRTG